MGSVSDCRIGVDASTRRDGIWPDVDDDVLRQRVHESGIRPGDQDQVRCVRADPSPQHVRFDVLAVGNA